MGWLFPLPAVLYVAYGLGRHSKFLSDGDSGRFAVGEQSTYLSHIGLGKFGCFTAPRIDRNRHGFQMIWVDATRHSTKMIERFMGWSICAFVVHAMCRNLFTVEPCVTVATTTDASLPYPARGFISTVFHLIFGGGFSFVVVFDKSGRLVFFDTFASVIERSQRSLFPATTFT